ncbi:MAG: hypothetical protein HSCHL_2071 [Hydrogenibacillus schlegelii]|uniref:Uncharacterized protein n=1 Tax=Hydrogenibacillus schlegelii TaxID=1484 RepID=A0A2T5GB83_HYDSH|nr:MAG: hypothetical protein HSCHL_2071 [Hydrogenibacillus schlegelii]
MLDFFNLSFSAAPLLRCRIRVFTAPFPRKRGDAAKRDRRKAVAL